jgi:hypothetical protein
MYDIRTQGGRMSTVYFTDFRSGSKGNVATKIRRMFERGEFSKAIEKNDFVALKTHFGELGNFAFIPAPILRIFVDIASDLGGKPFVTDSNTLYRGSRSNAVDHLKNASLHGFTMECVGAPVVIADGIRGNDYRTVPYNGKQYRELKISSAIHDANAVIVVSHVKGHELYGFGGALKNIAMGCVPPSGKQTIHSEFKPRVKEADCKACGKCIAKCPVDAIAYNANKKANINQNICIGCGECVVVCPYGAIPVVWKTSHKPLHERTAEYVKGILDTKPGKWIFFNFIMNVSPDCDCFPWNDAPVVSNIGIAASFDPVALDRACADLVNRSEILPGSRLFTAHGECNVIHKIGGEGWEYLFQCCEKEGVGESAYELVEI